MNNVGYNWEGVLVSEKGAGTNNLAALTAHHIPSLILCNYGTSWSNTDFLQTYTTFSGVHVTTEFKQSFITRRRELIGGQYCKCENSYNLSNKQHGNKHNQQAKK